MKAGRSRGFGATISLALFILAGCTAGDELMKSVQKTVAVATGGAAPEASSTNVQAGGAAETLDPASDRLCDSLSQSYSVTENLVFLAGTELRCRLMKCQPNEIIPKDDAQLTPWLREYSKKRVWIPVPFESMLGAATITKLKDQGMILDRGIPASDKLYAKVDAALAGARKSYPKVPYELKVYIVDVSDQVNAQASPGGNIIVTRAAAKNLDGAALQLVIGHEVAHLAKRHLSKQLQQRLLETSDGVDLFKRLTVNQTESMQRVGEASKIVDRLKCSFASYDVDQESQADACAARVMVEAGGDPVVAWTEYLRTRGTTTPAKAAPAKTTGAACVASLAKHPTDRQRDTKLRQAASHHRAKAPGT
jgi:hypothetical protein